MPTKHKLTTAVSQTEGDGDKEAELPDQGSSKSPVKGSQHSPGGPSPERKGNRDW